MQLQQFFIPAVLSASCLQQQQVSQQQQQAQQQQVGTQQQQGQQQLGQQMGGIGVQPGAWNGSLLDNLNNQFQLRNVSLLLRSYCGQEIQRVLNNRTAQETFFAPSDTSFSQALDMSNKMGGAEFNCSVTAAMGNGSAIAEYCDPSSIPLDLHNVTFYNVSACSPLILQYHLVPNEVLNLTQSSSGSGGGMGGKFRTFQQRQGQTGISGGYYGQQQQGGLMGGAGGMSSGSSAGQNTLNVTVLQTMLNDTRFVNLPNNGSQVLILNQTSDGFYLRHGAWPDAKVRVNESIHGVNGIAYIIDGPLFPPLNLSSTLQKLNMTNQAYQSLQASNQSGGQQQGGGGFFGRLKQPFAGSQQQSGQAGQAAQGDVSSMQGITVFLPIESALQGNQAFNFTSYVFPQVIYNNGTLNQTSFTALDGASYNISTDAISYNMTIGNASVIESNILLSNGVLHLINGTISSSSGAGANATSGTQV